MKTIYCKKCKTIIAKVNKGEVRKYINVYCGKCVDNMISKIDLPPGFKELFGEFRN